VSVEKAEDASKLDGFDVPVKSLAGGVITLDAPLIHEARQVTVEVALSTASDYLFPGFTYGFRRGDANNDGMLALSDAVFILSYLFSGGAAPACEDSADADDLEKIELTDAVYILNYLFLGTKPAPPPPFRPPARRPEGSHR